MFFVMGGGFRTLIQFIFSALWAVVVVVCCVLFNVFAYLIFAIIGLSVYGLIEAVAIYPVIAKYTDADYQNKISEENKNEYTDEA